MSMRDKLVADMNSFIAESRWEETLQEIMEEVLETQPKNPYSYLQKKTSLKAKLESPKGSGYVVDLTMYATSYDPLRSPKEQFLNRVICLCVDRHQHTKIKRVQIMQFMSVVLMPLGLKQKELFLTLVSQSAGKEFYTPTDLAHVLYWTSVYWHVMRELLSLEERLARVNQRLGWDVLRQYLECVKVSNSILKAAEMEYKPSSDASQIYKETAMEISDRIKI